MSTAPALPEERAVSPLRDYAIPLVSLDVESELRMARESLEEAAARNIHDHHDMLRSAVDLMLRLRSLADAVEAGEGK
ncbi:hypothetical protein [Streptomyces antibioticus]|uniref:hypothetical protein n=1 Tax=Streptomyces antibioticus TaxID=1890 RepID=UPI003D72F461